MSTEVDSGEFVGKLMFVEIMKIYRHKDGHFHFDVFQDVASNGDGNTMAEAIKKHDVAFPIGMDSEVRRSARGL